MLDFGLELDLEKSIGWSGATVSTTWLWLSGRDASEDLVGNFLTISNIAGFNTLRMLELWFEQNVWDDKITLRLGQLTADSEFVISDYAGTFINGTFGWPAFLYTNLPAGGPGYPMGTLGARLALNPVDWLTFQSAVFQGNVYDQDVNRHGFRWRLDGENGFLFLNEAQVRWNHADEETGLPGQAKSGIWIQTGQLADTLAESTDSGNYGLYFILDQMLYREPSAEEPPAPRGDGKSVASGKSFKSTVQPSAPKLSKQGLSTFNLLTFAPGYAVKNVYPFYFQSGLVYTGLIPHRDEDLIMISLGYGAYQGDVSPTVDGYTAVIEGGYRFQINGWSYIQPFAQYFSHPNGTGSAAVQNAAVLGFTAGLVF